MAKALSLKNILLCLSVSAGLCAWAAEPSGYYSSCENKNGAALLSALQAKMGSHTVVSYDGLWDLYKTSDSKANGKIWDMYSTKEWTHGKEKCGNYKLVGDCVNREHSFPKSWFNDASPMYSDAFHLYPTDGKVNGQRSNFPYGECANGTTLPSNGSVKALGKLGKSTFSGYSGTVFEPVDEYKGDFARSYFYMAAAYNDRIASWNSDMLAGNAYPAFSSWALNVLLKWHRQDPVSQKELDRQEAVYARQKNRNPFIDHPELVEYIWGDKKSQQWTLGAGADPVISLPANGSAIDLGTSAVGVARSKTFTVKGSSLTEAVTLTIAGTGFSVSPTSVSASAANSADGATATITYKATAATTASATLTVQSGGIKNTVTVTAQARDGLPATAPTNVSDQSFVAHWTFIGDADANGCYTINVYEANGDMADTYPRSANAAAEEFLVDELMAETEYSYDIVSASGIRSNRISVTTAAPIPSIQFLYDGDLVMTAAPGEPSEAHEILLDVENIDTDITLSVAQPFELSSDKGTWSQKLVVDPREDRFFLRVNSAKEGTFASTLRAVAGEYITDDTEISATVMASIAFMEDFEVADDASTSYSQATAVGKMCTWNLSNACKPNESANANSGDLYIRLGKNKDSYLEMATAKKGGIGTVTLYAKRWSEKEAEATLVLQASTDDGATWTDCGSITPSAAYQKYSFAVNMPGYVRLRLQQTAGARACIDDIEASDFRSGIDGVESNYRSWTAYCQAGELVVEAAADCHVKVYGVDGIMYVNTNVAAGTHNFKLTDGLYIVAIDDFTRTVLVK